MATIAFHAPMKPPDDPVPSGDRTMARSLMTALGGLPASKVELFSRLRTRDRSGDASIQDDILASAEREIERLAKGARPDLWLTYHSYYKAPDLLGPALSSHWDIPYVLVEATRARKRLNGPYARFAVAAEKACDAADVIFYLTESDGEALLRDRPAGQKLLHLRPFLAQEALDPPASRQPRQAVSLVACGMFRPGDKLASYTALAKALALVQQRNFTLTIIGDGPERTTVEALFATLRDRVRFTGALDADGVAKCLREADLLVWPGVGEAFGMVYLEAQAQGCPTLAEDRPGVREVVRDGGWLTPAGDAQAFATMIDRLASDPAALLDRGAKARARISADHLLGGARATLAAGLAPLLDRQAR